MDWVLAVFVRAEGDFERSPASSGEPAVCADFACDTAADVQVHRGCCSSRLRVSAEAGLHGGRRAAGESWRHALRGRGESDWSAGEYRIKVDPAVRERESLISVL